MIMIERPALRVASVPRSENQPGKIKAHFFLSVLKHFTHCFFIEKMNEWMKILNLVKHSVIWKLRMLEETFPLGGDMYYVFSLNEGFFNYVQLQQKHSCLSFIKFLCRNDQEGNFLLLKIDETMSMFSHKERRVNFTVRYLSSAADV